MAMTPSEDRRRWKRYAVGWPFRITGVSAVGEVFENEGTLCNISARGSLGVCKNPPQEGTRLEIYITIPFGIGKQIRYLARVVRVESGPNATVAFMFDTAQPAFNAEPPQAEAMLSTETKPELVPEVQ